MIDTNPLFYLKIKKISFLHEAFASWGIKMQRIHWIKIIFDKFSLYFCHIFSRQSSIAIDLGNFV